jgi:hypothetical protein
VNEAREHLRIGSRGAGQAQQSGHRVLGAPEIGLELSEQLVAKGQIRIELQCPGEAPLGLSNVLCALTALTEKPIASAQTSPRRCVARVLLQAALIEVSGHAQLVARAQACHLEDVIGP